MDHLIGIILFTRHSVEKRESQIDAFLRTRIHDGEFRNKFSYVAVIVQSGVSVAEAIVEVEGGVRKAIQGSEIEIRMVDVDQSLGYRIFRRQGRRLLMVQVFECFQAGGGSLGAGGWRNFFISGTRAREGLLPGHLLRASEVGQQTLL